MKNIVLLIAALACCGLVSAQQIKGNVSEINGDGSKAPLAYANVYWAESSLGTTTDSLGNFELQISANAKLLVVNFVGYENDTMTINNTQKFVSIVLLQNSTLSEVEIKARHSGSYISSMTPLKSEVITTAGLQKLACCNLGESFENSASVDVNFSDAVTGAKQIKMLGLSGVYSQMMFENIPSLRGLVSPFALSYVPGSWMESIQISKGAASVTNGYESVTGQINVEFKKPENSEKLFVNLYGNLKGRMEANVMAAQKLKKNWSTMLLTHYSENQLEHDKNKDGFLDMPLSRQLNVFNRWKYRSEKGIAGQFGFSFLSEERKGGQYAAGAESLSSRLYLTQIKTHRAEFYSKTGYAFKNKAYKSIGLQTKTSVHRQESNFGDRVWLADQNSTYANLIYQTIIGTTDHKINMGASYQYDEYKEQLMGADFDRTESVPGVFSQYNYSRDEKLNLIVGLRYDQHSLFGGLITPRTHLRWQPHRIVTLRASAGKAYRSPNAIAENVGALSSSRQLVFLEKAQLEQAWNYGLSATFKFELNKKLDPLTIAFDYFRTDFENQYIADYDFGAQQVVFYNLRGNSHSNSFQTDVLFNPFEGVELNLAYRWNDVMVDQLEGSFQKAFVKRHKGLVNLAYATRYERWKFDFTWQLNGPSRLPSTTTNPEEYQREEESPAFSMLHFQMTRKFRLMDVYAGVENLLDYRQENAIVAANDPFGKYFDSSLIWGPLRGRMVYAGLRFSIK